MSPPTGPDFTQQREQQVLLFAPWSTMPEQHLTDRLRTAVQAEIRKRRSAKALRYDELAEWAHVQLKPPFSLSRSVLSFLSTSLSKSGDVLNNEKTAVDVRLRLP